MCFSQETKLKVVKVKAVYCMEILHVLNGEIFSSLL